MTYRYQQKTGLWLLGVATALFLFYTVPQIGMLAAGVGRKQWALLLLVYLLLLVLFTSKYFVLRGVRIDEQGLTVERRWLRSLTFPWAELTVAERRGARRVAAGLVLERADEEAAYFLLLDRLPEGQAQELQQALRARLGARYHEEEWKRGGTSASGDRD